MAIELPSYIAGEAVRTDRWLDVYYPWDHSLTGRVAMIGPQHLNQAIEAALAGHSPLTPRMTSVLVHGSRNARPAVSADAPGSAW